MSWVPRISVSALAILIFAQLISIEAAYSDSDEVLLSKENKLKAAYFFNFIKFIDWPHHSSNSPLTPLHICLQDGTSFENFFRDLVEKKSTANSEPKLKIQRLSEADYCDYTYLHKTFLGESLNMEGNVIVLESKQISQKGASIVFFITDRKVRFEIDLNNIHKNQVAVSSELLKLAKIK
ncbi:MAG: YfiR family protein [Halioglobus sp.]|nr:YfiR family protein [Halioglobus sp.]